ncbi:hypothetical protein TWF481_002714 [Arthrobotrys musiformis]|uniref:Uncharacterized protein n=1 Tax=Arthrobotrys musiformis TaxID=47236 RepID=A0AAV9VTG6_9PEZI
MKPTNKRRTSSSFHPLETKTQKIKSVSAAGNGTEEQLYPHCPHYRPLSPAPAKSSSARDTENMSDGDPKSPNFPSLERLVSATICTTPFDPSTDCSIKKGWATCWSQGKTLKMSTKLRRDPKPSKGCHKNALIWHSIPQNQQNHLMREEDKPSDI